MGRNSRPKVFCKKGVLRNFAKFTGNTCARHLYCNKVAGLMLLLDKIKSLKEGYVGENYPSVNSVTLSNAEAVIPSSVKRFLSCLITNTDESTKIEAIGHSIMQVTFPRTLIMPLQKGLVVHLHDHFASKYLKGTLYQLGFCMEIKQRSTTS